MRFSTWLLSLPLLLTMACGDDDSSPASTCTPNQQIACACPGGTTSGVQVCDASGESFSACTGCGPGPAGGQGGQTAGGQGGGSGQGGSGQGGSGQGGSGQGGAQAGDGGAAPGGAGGGESGSSGQGGAGAAGQGGSAGAAAGGAQGGAGGAQGGAGGSAGTEGGAGCAGNAVDLVRRPAQVLVVLDRSGSMADEGKWAAVVSGLNEVFEQAPGALEVGMLRFPEGSTSPCGGSDLSCQTDFECTDIKETPNVPVGPLAQTRAAMKTLMDSTTPEGGTPTRAALGRAWASQKASAAAGDKVVLLVTDGEPTYYQPAQPPLLPELNKSCGTQTDLAKETTASFKEPPPVRTLVVGVPGSEGAQATLSGIAQNGGGCRPGGSPRSNTCHYQMGASGLESSLASIGGQILSSLSCRFEAAGDLGGANTQLVVLVDGLQVTPVPAGGPDGWSYTDSTHQVVQLSGSACALVTGNANATVQFRYNCP